MKRIAIAIIILGILLVATIYRANLISEPAAMVMLGIGLIGLAGVGRKKIFKR